MKDYLGKELKVGDQVIYIDRGYRSYMKAIITRFTKQKVELRISPAPFERYLLQEPFRIIKI